MITSPKSYNPDSERAKLEKGIERLKIISNAAAMTVCHRVSCGDTNIGYYSKYARVALAANSGHTKMMLKYLKRR